MDRGTDFLKSQVNNAVMQHGVFLRALVGDIVLARQVEDTFKSFREAGRMLRIDPLAEIGETGERHHDSYVKEANRLCQQMFVEHVRGPEPVQSATVDAIPPI